MIFISALLIGDETSIPFLLHPPLARFLANLFILTFPSFIKPNHTSERPAGNHPPPKSVLPHPRFQLLGNTTTTSHRRQPIVHHLLLRDGMVSSRTVRPTGSAPKNPQSRTVSTPIWYILVSQWLEQFFTHIKHKLSVEAGTWQPRAKYNENMIANLKYNLQQVFAQSKDSKEGCGDSKVDDTASCCKNCSQGKQGFEGVADL